MRNEKLSNTIAQACLIGGLFLLVLQCAFGQQRTPDDCIQLDIHNADTSLGLVITDHSPSYQGSFSGCGYEPGSDRLIIGRALPDNSPDFAWNNAKWFRSYEYLKTPDQKFFDWSNYPVTWDGKQTAIWGLFALSGVAHGIREAYHADPYLFERRNGVAPTSFWGSDAWKRNYTNNDPDQPHKSELYGNVGRDVWHTANMVDFIPLATASITMGARRHPTKYKIANVLIGVGLRTLFSTITYQTLRNTR